MGKDEIKEVSQLLEAHQVGLENTRLKRLQGDERIPLYEVWQAGISQQSSIVRGLGKEVHIKCGDHHKELTSICIELSKALPYATELQKKTLQSYITSFESGDLDHYRNSQKSWVQDQKPRIENVFGFVEPYRDPSGVRAEFEGLVGINSDDKVLTTLVENSTSIIKNLPWVSKSTMDSLPLGPFENARFEPPHIASIYGKYPGKILANLTIYSIGVLLIKSVSCC